MNRVLLLGALLSSLLLPSNGIFAQTAASPELLLTWRATNSYAPPGYEGKILPAIDQPIEVAVEMIDKGKHVDLSNYDVQWLLNGHQLQSGRGLATVLTRAAGSIEVVIRGYGSAALRNNIAIPPPHPQVIISAAEPLQTMTGKEIRARALPYFFSIKSISGLFISWLVNGQPPINSTGEPDQLTIDVKGQTPAPITISVRATNKTDENETANNTVTISK